MELISPQQYENNIKEKSLEEIKKIKNELLLDISNLERLSRHPEDSIFEIGQADVKLSVYKKYLLKIEEIIKVKENK